MELLPFKTGPSLVSRGYIGLSLVCLFIPSFVHSTDSNLSGLISTVISIEDDTENGPTF